MRKKTVKLGLHKLVITACTPGEAYHFSSSHGAANLIGYQNKIVTKRRRSSFNPSKSPENRAAFCTSEDGASKFLRTVSPADIQDCGAEKGHEINIALLELFFGADALAQSLGSIRRQASLQEISDRGITLLAAATAAPPRRGWCDPRNWK